MKYIIALILLCGSAQAQTYNPMPVGSSTSIGNPTISVQSGAGGGSATINGTNVSGGIVVTTGGSPLANANLATITFGGTDTHNVCTLTAQNINAVGQTSMVYATPIIYPNWSIGIGGNALPANTPYQWSYICI